MVILKADHFLFVFLLRFTITYVLESYLGYCGGVVGVLRKGYYWGSLPTPHSATSCQKIEIDHSGSVCI